MERSAIVKVSDEDLGWIAADSTAEDCPFDGRMGPAIVVVTMAERGAFAGCANGTARVSARSVDVVDTVGPATPSRRV